MEWGFYVSSVKTNEENKVLYSLNGYFAEMCLSLKDNKVIAATAFAKEELPNRAAYALQKDSPFLQSAGLMV